VYGVYRNKETSELTVQLVKDVQEHATCSFDILLTKKSQEAKFEGVFFSALPLIQSQALAGNTTGGKKKSRRVLQCDDRAYFTLLMIQYAGNDVYTTRHCMFTLKQVSCR